MRARRAALAVLAVGVVGLVVGCLDALAPARAPREATVALAPLFGGVANHDGIPADVDSIVVTIHNPPAPDITISQRILPGQDSIVITIDIPITGATVDTVQMSLEAIRTGPPVEVLYRADSVPMTIRVGTPTRADTVRADYVGPGAGILRAITLTPRSVVLRPGDSLAFAFTAIDSTGASCCATMPMLWDSRSTGVAQVGARGVVTARSNGRAWIVATAGASAAIRDSVEIVVATGPVALISFGPSAATFNANTGQANPAAQVVNVTNGGAGTLTNLAVTGMQYTSGQPAGWLSATLAGASAPTTLTLNATTGTLPPGTYAAGVSLASSQASNSPIALPVTFVVDPVPAIGLTPTSVTVVDTLTTSDPAAKTVAVTNAGTGTLSGLAVGTVTYGAGQPTGWLGASLGGTTTAPATLTLTFAKGTLPFGVYTATVPITSPVGENSPRNLAVTFDVRPLPMIGLSPMVLSIVDTVTTSDPAAKTVAVTNAGTGTLGGLAVGAATYGAGQPNGWLTANLGATTAPSTLTVSVAKGALPPGVYTATIPVTSAAAGNSPQTVSVTFDVRPLPTIGLTPAALIFTDTLTTSDPAAQTVAVANVGTGTLTSLKVGTVTYGAGATGWLAATLSDSTAPATLTVGVAKGVLPVGVYTATIQITSVLAGNSPQTVSVSFDVQPGPAIGLTPETVGFIDTLTTTDPAPKTVAVTNTGNATLSGLAVATISYGASQPTGWITATLGDSTAPATLTIGVAKGTLPVGVYTATIPITSAVAGNSPRTVSVSFDVQPGPAIGLSATSATFTDTVLTSDPAAKTVSVTNTSGGTLSGLTLGTVDYGATGPAGWLTATLSDTAAPATLTLSVAKGSLAPGTYTATVPLTSPVASNAPRSVTVSFTLLPPPLTAMKITPGFGVVVPTGTQVITATGVNATGGAAPTLGLWYRSRSPAVATVDSLTGIVTGVAGGTAIVVATAPGATGPVSDSTLVAVAASGVAVAMPVAGGRAFGAAKVGDTVVVRVLVDLRGVPTQKLGSYNAQLDWAPATLRYVRSTAVTGGFTAATLNETATATGQLRFGAADPAGTAGPTIGILDITFVADAAGTSALTFALTDLSASSPSYLQMRPAAMVLSGGVRVQ